MNTKQLAKEIKKLKNSPYTRIFSDEVNEEMKKDVEKEAIELVKKYLNN